MTGLVMAPLQLFLFPLVIKIVGAVRWMHMGCLVGVVAFLATPNASAISGGGETRLFLVSVASTTVVNCCLAAVSLLLRRMYDSRKLQPARRRVSKPDDACRS